MGSNGAAVVISVADIVLYHCVAASTFVAFYHSQLFTYF